jgi:hypothetical protein
MPFHMVPLQSMGLQCTGFSSLCVAVNNPPLDDSMAAAKSVKEAASRVTVPSTSLTDDWHAVLLFRVDKVTETHLSSAAESIGHAVPTLLAISEVRNFLQAYIF